MVPTGLVIFLQGDFNNTTGVPFGDGVRCIGGVLKRLAVKPDNGGTASYPELGDPSISARSAQLGDPIQYGQARVYQAYYRDSDPNFACSATFNATSGLFVAWAP
jgi:hypothetical protein